MNPNEYGQIANKQWKWLAKQYPYVILHAFVVMPNHVHGVIEINRDMVVGTGHDPSPGHDIAGTGRDLSPQLRDLSPQLRDLSPQLRDLSLTLRREKIKPLPEIMGAYKTTVSKQIHLAGYTDFGWQRSFHDHIIRDEKSFLTISKYITNNPLNWGEDFFGP